MICKTNIVAEGACSGGAWAAGDFSSTSPAIAQYATPERAYDAYLYYPFVCDASGVCSEPIRTSPDVCPHFDVIAAGDDPGPYACDQTPAVGDETDYPPPASPIPISGMTGRPKTSGFKTELWGEDETLVESGMRVIVSTAPGTFALTGGVIDGDTAEAVVGALVVVELSRGVTVRTRTDEDGAFAFIDVPVAHRGERGVFTVRAAGYELHRVADEYWPDTYAITAELDASR